MLNKESFSGTPQCIKRNGATLIYAVDAVAVEKMIVSSKLLNVPCSISQVRREKHDIWHLRDDFNDLNQYEEQCVYLYCHDEDGLDVDCERLYEKGIAAFDGNAPTYHIELKGKPLLVWDFHSLLLCIELLFSIMLTDDATPLRMCKNCQSAFIAKGIDDEFCSEKCREEKE